MEVDYSKLIPVRDESGNKGTFGKVTVIAGSYGMAGAAFLSSLAVLRTGAGMVRIFTPESNRVILQTLIPEAILSVYDTDTDMKAVMYDALRWSDVIAAGPGLGTSESSLLVLNTLFRLYETEFADRKLILDADAINLIASNSLNIPVGCVITPHMMEMSSLTGRRVEELKSDGREIALEFSVKHSCTVVLKDHMTVISTLDGRQTVNTIGSSALAKAGTGDVLTGIISGLLAQGMDEYDAAVLGTYVHGLSGEKCAAGLTEYGVLARDVANCVPYAIYSIMTRDKINKDIINNNGNGKLL